jgi:class 3 adenylate cyclase
VLTWIFVPGWCVFAVWLLHLPAFAILMLLPAALTFVFYVEALRFLLSEIALTPVLADIAKAAPDDARLGASRVRLRWRQLLVLPGINVITGVVVAGIVGGGTASVQDIAVAIIAAVIVAGTVSLLLTGLLSNSVTAPIVALRDAAERVGRGDFAARVPVLATDETGELAQAFNSMTAGLAEREHIRDAFGTYVDHEVAEHILREGTSLAGEEVEVTMMFLDARNFTAFAERASARDVVATINRTFQQVVPIIHEHGGHIDKFVGDGLLAVFGAPRRRRDHADQALAAALAIAQTVGQNGHDELAISVGLNSGRVIAGNVGGAGRYEFSVIGDAVNVAARIESATRDTGDAVLISEHTKRLLRRQEVGLKARPGIPHKGKTDPVAVYAPESNT